MRHKDHSEEEIGIMTNIASLFPTFLGGVSFSHSPQDPPDFISTLQDGKRVGLELTCWLDKVQTREAKWRGRIRQQLLEIVECQNLPRPKNYSVAVIMPKWGKVISQSHSDGVRSEFHAVAQRIDATWEELRAKHWAPLGPKQKFDYEAHQNELGPYPILSRYVKSIWFSEGSGTETLSAERSWVSTESDGGFYEPRAAIGALRIVVEQKLNRFNKARTKAHLGALDLCELYLLVYAHPELFASNTPYQDGSQMMISPTEGLREAAETSLRGISEMESPFRGIFLFYPLWNSRWLAQIWPTFRRVECLEQK